MAIANIANGESGSSARGKINSAFSVVNDLDPTAGNVYRGDGTGIDAVNEMNFIAPLYYRVLSGLPVPLIIQEGNNITGNSSTVDFTEPIDSLVYKKLDLTAGVSTTISTRLVFSGINGVSKKGIIIGVDDDNYFELIFYREGIVFRRIESGTVTLTENGTISLFTRNVPTQININLGGKGTRSGFGFSIKVERQEQVFTFVDNQDSINENLLSFIALFDIIGQPYDNFAVCSTKFS